MEIEHFIFQHEDERESELLSIYENLQRNVEMLRQLHQKGEEPSFEIIGDAINILYEASIVINSHDLENSMVQYILDVTEKNAPYLRKKLKNTVRLNSEQFDRVGRLLIHAHRGMQQGSYGVFDENFKRIELNVGQILTNDDMNALNSLSTLELKMSKSFDSALKMLREIYPIGSRDFKTHFLIKCNIASRKSKPDIFACILEDDLDDLQHGLDITIASNYEVYYVRPYDYKVLQKIETMEEYLSVCEKYIDEF